MADLYASRAPVRLNDGTADANNAAIQNSAPAGTEYALVVRPIMPASSTVDTELPAAAVLTDNFATPTAPAVGAFAMVYDGSAWDFARGTSTDGLLVNLGANNDVTIASGSVTADTELPTAAAIAADAQSAPTAPGVYGWLMGYNGTNWDRVRVANTGRLQVDVVTGGGSNASVLVDNAGFTPDTSSVTAIGGLFDETAGAALTENDIAAVRINANRAQVFVGEDATTRSQKWAISAAGALSQNLTQIGGSTPSATVALPARLTDGTSFYTRTGQTQATGVYSAISDGTTTAGVIVSTTALKTDLSSVAGTATVTGGVNGSQGVGGLAAHDATLAGNPVIIGGASSAAAPADVTADGEAVRLWALRNGSQVVNIAAGGTLWTNMGQAAASGQFVRLTNGTLTASILDLTTTDPLAVAIVDGTGAQITSFGGGTQYVGDAAATATPTGTMAMGRASAAAPADVSADNDAVAQWMLRNGSAVTNLASGGTLITAGQKVMTASLPVVIASDQSAITVDTELPTAASISADGQSAPTAPGVYGWLMGYNGTSWDRVRVANTGRLQVDVLSGGGSAPPSGVPSGYNLIGLYGTSAAVASGATQAAVVTNTPANTKGFFVRTVRVVASGQTKWQVKFGATVLDTGFNPQSMLSQTVFYDPPLAGTGDGSTALTVDVTNREASAMDVYAALRGYVAQ